MIEPFDDEAPTGEVLTDYDRAHVRLYARMLDAHAEGSDWREVTEVLFGIPANRDPERARKVHDSHLRRAKWMTKVGHKLL